MHPEFAFLSLPKDELVEVYRAMLTRFLIQNALRREQGLEEADYPPALEEMERVLGIDEEAAHRLFHLMEDELWEYSWYTYTDEWAWYRARRDVMKELGASAKAMSREELERLIEKRYEEKFDRYIAEIDMREEEPSKKPKVKSQKFKSKGNK